MTLARIRLAQRALIFVSVLLYATTVDYFLCHRNVILSYNGVPVPVWTIPVQVTHFVTLLQLTAVFAASALLLEFVKVRGGVEDGGKAEREKAKREKE